MKIHILTMEDPIYTNDFIAEIIESRHEDITGVTIAKGGRLKIGKKRSKTLYILSLLLIMGPFFFTQNVFKTLSFKIRKKLSSLFPSYKVPGLKSVANKFDIPVNYTSNPNSEEYLNKLREIDPDIIINQSQFILKKELLEIPNIGVLNRHNALLPKNRGRLTPFWVLYKREKETGVSIHFVEQDIDSGNIVVQKKFQVTKEDTFNTIVKKNYKLASKAMLEALDQLADGKSNFIKNDDEQATYNTVPKLKEALAYRLKRMGIR